MTNIQEQLGKELKDLTLTDHTKRQILKKAKTSNLDVSKRKVYRGRRIVFSTMLLLFIGFGYILISRNQLEFHRTTTSQTPVEQLYSYTQTPTFQIIMLIVLWMLCAYIINHGIQRRGKALPNCVHCHTKWSYQTALKKVFIGNKVVCPTCGGEQFKTKKTVRSLNLFTLAIPFGIILNTFFTFANGLIIFFSYTTSILVLMLLFGPYLLRCQREDPTKEPWY